MEEINSDQVVPMKLRIFLLLLAFPVLAASIVGQTAPPANTPTAAQNPPENTSAPPVGKKQAPAAQTPPAPAPAQPSNPATSDSDESVATIVHVVNEVRVVFTVTDRHGRYIKDLKKDAFRVIDDQKPAEMRSFRSETDLPLQVGLLVDASNSVRDRFKFEQEAAIEFLNAIIRPGYDKAFVVGLRCHA